MDDWREDGGGTTLFGELYIQVVLSLLAVVSLRLIFADLYVEGLTEVSTQSPRRPNTENWITPVADLPGSKRLSPICTRCCRGGGGGTVLGAQTGVTPACLPPFGSVVSLGRHDNLYEALSDA